MFSFEMEVWLSNGVNGVLLGLLSSSELVIIWPQHLRPKRLDTTVCQSVAQRIDRRYTPHWSPVTNHTALTTHHRTAPTAPAPTVSTHQSTPVTPHCTAPHRTAQHRPHCTEHTAPTTPQHHTDHVTPSHHQIKI
jgi:hypothetical protein